MKTRPAEEVTRRMRRAASACLVALSLASAAPTSADGGCARWPFPLAETEWVLGRWLAEAGFSVRRDAPGAGVIRLSGEKGTERREVLLQPNSALATCVRPGGAPNAARERELSEVLRRYAGTDPRTSTLRDDEVPRPVLARRATAVCLEAEQAGRVLRSSGFVLDQKSRILTTAHDLEGVRQVTATWENGTRAKGRLVRADSGTDLALWELEAPAASGVSFQSARGLLDAGEEVFAIGCPSGAGETIRSGRVRLPMVKVGPLRLWAVEMETLPGGSGSPVFDAKGNLAGVVKGRFRGTEASGFLIPVEAVVRFLDAR